MRKPSNGADSASDLMSDFEYESLLDRARSNIPEQISNRQRWNLHDQQTIIEASNTILPNITEHVNHMKHIETQQNPFKNIETEASVSYTHLTMTTKA